MVQDQVAGRGRIGDVDASILVIGQGDASRSDQIGDEGSRQSDAALAAPRVLLALIIGQEDEEGFGDQHVFTLFEMCAAGIRLATEVLTVVSHFR